MTLEQRIATGEIVILDGTTGTELEKRGVPMDDAAWCAAALATYPDVVRSVHEDYIRAGADVIITNTFPAAKHVLKETGLGERFRELNARAVELARDARENVAEDEVYISSSSPNVARNSSPWRVALSGLPPQPGNRGGMQGAEKGSSRQFVQQACSLETTAASTQ